MTELDKELSEFREKERLRNIKHAIWYWNKKLEGFQFWWDRSPDTTKEWCKEQIDFFTKMLNEKL